MKTKLSFNFYNKLFKIGILAFYLLAFPGCEIINPEEEVPSYIQIGNIDIYTDYSTQGSSSNKITDAWVYVGGELIGAFELPAKVPVLASGNQSIRIQPGIKINGIAATRSPYPFYKSFEITEKLIPANVLSLSPSVTYVDNAKFEWKEDFEQVGITLVRTTRSDTIITNNSPTPFEGSKSGYVKLTESRPFFECRSFDNFKLPVGLPVYLELNYKTNNIITLGIVANKFSQEIIEPVLNINPTVNENGLYWNKIYINLAPAIAKHYDALSFKIFLGAVKSTEVAEPEIHLDNIKLIH